MERRTTCVMPLRIAAIKQLTIADDMKPFQIPAISMLNAIDYTVRSVSANLVIDNLLKLLEPANAWHLHGVNRP